MAESLILFDPDVVPSAWASVLFSRGAIWDEDLIGTADVSGDAAVTLDALTNAAAGTVAVAGAAAITLDALTLTANNDAPAAPSTSGPGQSTLIRWGLWLPLQSR